MKVPIPQGPSTQLYGIYPAPSLRFQIQRPQTPVFGLSRLWILTERNLRSEFAAEQASRASDVSKAAESAEQLTATIKQLEAGLLLFTFPGSQSLLGIVLIRGFGPLFYILLGSRCGPSVFRQTPTP